MYIKVSEVFSKTPGGRYAKDGKYSAEKFLDDILDPAYSLALEEEKILVVDLDGGYGYADGFLEESFGGLVRRGHYYQRVLDNMLIISTEEPLLIDKVKGYIIDEGIRQKKELNKGGKQYGKY